MAKLQPVGVPREFSDSFAALKAVPLFFFGVVDKYKKRWRVDKRVVAVTDCYLFTARLSGEISRCIDLKMIAEVLIEHPQKRLALKIPQQYDLCIQTDEYLKLSEVLKVLVEGVKNGAMKTTILPQSERVGSSKYEVQLHKPTSYKLEIKNEEQIIADETATPPEQDIPQEVRPIYRPSVTPSLPSVLDEPTYSPPPARTESTPNPMPKVGSLFGRVADYSFPPQEPPNTVPKESAPVVEQSLPAQSQEPLPPPQEVYAPPPRQELQYAPPPPQEPHYAPPPQAIAYPQENPPAPLPTQDLFAAPTTTSTVTVSAPVTGVDPTRPPHHVVHSTFGSQPAPTPGAHGVHSPPDILQDATALLPPYQSLEPDSSSTITVHVPFQRETFTPYDSSDYPSVNTQEPLQPAAEVARPIDPMGRWPGVSTPHLAPEPQPEYEQPPQQQPEPPLPPQMHVFYPATPSESVLSSKQPTPHMTPLEQPAAAPTHVSSQRSTPHIQPQAEEPLPFLHPTPPQQPQPQPAYTEPLPTQTEPTFVNTGPMPAHVEPTPAYTEPLSVHIEPTPAYIEPAHTEPAYAEPARTEPEFAYAEPAHEHVAQQPITHPSPPQPPSHRTPSEVDMQMEIALPTATIDTSLGMPMGFDDQVQVPSMDLLQEEPAIPTAKPSAVGYVPEAFVREASPQPDYVELPWGRHSPAGKIAAAEHTRAREAELKAARLMSEIMSADHEALEDSGPLNHPAEPPVTGFPTAPLGGIKTMRGVSPPRPGRSETPLATSPRTGVKNMLNELLAADTPPKNATPAPASRRTTLELGLPVGSSWPEQLPQDVKSKFSQALKCDTAAAIGIAPHQVEIESFADVDGTMSVNFVLNRPDEGDEDVLSVRYNEMAAHSRIPIPETMRIIRDSGGLQPIGSRKASVSQTSTYNFPGQPLRGFQIQESSASASSYDPRYNSPSVDSALWRGETPPIPHELAEQQVMFAEQRAADLLAALQHDTQALQSDLQGTIDKERQEKENLAGEVTKLKQELRDMANKDLERGRRHSNARRDMETELTDLKRQIAHQGSSVFTDERRKLDNQVLALREDIRNLESKGLDKDMRNSEEKRALEQSLLALKTEVQKVSTRQPEPSDERLENEFEMLRQKVKLLDEKQAEKENLNEEDDRKLLTEIEKVKHEMIEMNTLQQAKDTELKQSIFDRERALNEGTSRIEKELEVMKKDMLQLTAESSKPLMQNTDFLENELLSIKESVGQMMSTAGSAQEARPGARSVDDRFPSSLGSASASVQPDYSARAAEEQALRNAAAFNEQARNAEILNLQKSYTDMIGSLETQVQHLHGELMQAKEREHLTQMQMEQQQQLSIQKEIEATARAEAQRYMGAPSSMQGRLPPLAPRPPTPLSHSSFAPIPARVPPPAEALNTCPEYTNVMHMLGDVYAKVKNDVSDKEARLRSVLSLTERAGVEAGVNDNEVQRLEGVLLDTRSEVDALNEELTVCAGELIAVREKRLQALLAVRGKAHPTGPIMPPKPYYSQRETTLPPSTPEHMRGIDLQPRQQPKHSSIQRLHNAESRVSQLQENSAQPNDVMSQVQACLNRTSAE